MDFYNHHCPVCKNQFEKDSDIVVCPECGTPHHRECYDELGHCFYEDKHDDGFDYKSESAQDTTNNNSQGAQGFGDIIPCVHCGTFNVSSGKYCSNCGKPLDKANVYTSYDRHSEESTAPSSGNQGQNGQQFSGYAYDAMGGLNPDEDLGAGVTVGEVAKFTKNTSSFYTRLFKQIKTFGRSRFSFVGFFFHGGWLLYRKMYKIGTIITAIMAVLIISQLVVGTYYNSLLTDFTEITKGISIFGSTTSMETVKEFLRGLNPDETNALLIYTFSSTGQVVLRIICAVCGNRWYYKHCIKHISKIKNSAGNKEAADTALQTKGGVNSAVAVSLLISYALLSFLPNFF